MRSVVLTMVSALGMIVSGSAFADTYSFPHVLDSNGSIAHTEGSLETVLRLTKGVDDDCDGIGPGEPVLLWLYDSDGLPFTAAGGLDVCAPCSFDLAAAGGTMTVSITDLMAAAGVGDGQLIDVFAVLETGGGPGKVAAGSEAFVFTATGPEMAGAYPPNPCEPSGAPEACRTYVLPHIFETRNGSGGPTFDTAIFITYLTGLPGGSGDPAADTTADLYLFDQNTGQPIVNDMGTPICDPCSYPLGGASQRKLTVPLESLITGGGGTVGDLMDITAVVVASGNAQDVHLRALTVKNALSPSDLSVFGFDPVPISSTARMSGVQEIARRYADLRSHPNPFNPATTLSYTLPRAGDVTLRVTDVRGRVVRTLEVGSQPEGDHEVMWDGRDDSGRPMPSGTYLARLETANFATVQKMALLK